MAFHFAGSLSIKTGTAIFPVPPGNWTIDSVQAVVGVANTGASVIADVNKNGTTIFGTQGNRPTIPASTLTTVTAGANSVNTATGGDRITCDIDAVGTAGNEGSHLTVTVTFSKV